MKYQQKKSR